MPLWGNVDTQAAKPKFPVERQVHAKQASVAVTQTSNTTTLNVNGSISTLNAQAGVGAAVSGNNIIAGTYISAYDVANSLITLSAAPTANLVAGDVLTVGNNISFHTNTYETTMNSDTILVTPSRLANAQVGIGDVNPGWVHIRKKVNNDGTVRYLHETLVALANPVASNTNSGNTSNTQIYSGV
jgi:hypothetical protein